MRNFLRSCIYFSSCIFVYLSIYFKIVWPQVCFSLLSSQATCRSRRCYRHREKGTATSQKPNLCLWGTWKFVPQNIRTEKISLANYLYINKDLQKICCSFFEARYINENFQLKYSRFKSSQSKNNHNNRGLFLSVERIIHHFHLISFTGLNRRTEPNDNYCKRKKKHPR